MVEDVTDIVLNLKRIKFKAADHEPRKLSLTVNKEGEVTAGDIQLVQGYEVLNPEQLICTLDKKHKFDAELEVRVGRGFATGDENKRADQPIGLIPIDSIFSPVTRVKYAVENTRVGQRTDYDKLILEVWTDGRLTPDDALLQASAILRHHLDVFVNFNEDVIEFDETPAGVSEENMKLKKLLNMSVNEIELSVRAANCLNNANITTVGQLAQKTEAEMLKYRNFGKKSLNEIKDKLQQLGLGLGHEIRSGPGRYADRVPTAQHQRLGRRRIGVSVRQFRSVEDEPMRHQKKDRQAGAHGGAPESAARESGLQSDRASADQDHAGESESGPSAGGKDGDARQERLAPCAPHRARRASAEGRGEEIVRRHRAAPARPQRRLHPHRQARPAQERLGSGRVSSSGWMRRRWSRKSRPPRKARSGSRQRRSRSADEKKPAGKAKKAAPNDKKSRARKSRVTCVGVPSIRNSCIPACRHIVRPRALAITRSRNISVRRVKLATRHPWLARRSAYWTVFKKGHHDKHYSNQTRARRNRLTSCWSSRRRKSAA